MIFYESFHLDINTPYSIYTVQNLNWGIHFHRAFECIFVIAGEIQCCVNQQDYLLHENEALFIMPNQLHAIKTPQQSHILVIRFHPEIVDHFYSQYVNQKPASNYFKPVNFDFNRLINTENYFTIIGLLYEICGIFMEQATFLADDTSDKELINAIFNYVESHFHEDCSLKNTAQELGYHYDYISKVFIKHTGTSFTSYVNHRRITQACFLITNTTDTFISIANACGFHSLRSFNRNFYQICNCTPSQYRSNRGL